MRRVLVTVLCVFAALSRLPAAAAAQSFALAEDGTRLAVHESGRGEVVVVVHGGPGLGSAYLRSGLQPLARRHRVAFFDQRGAGRSDVPDSTGYDVYAYVTDIEAVRRHLGAERITLVGHSWGAALAALYTAAFPNRVRSLVLLAPMPPRMQPWADSIRRAAQAGDPALAPALGRFARQMQEGEDPTAACAGYMTVLLRSMRVSGDPGAAVDCDAPPHTIRARDAVVRWTTQPLGAWDWRGTVAWITTPALIIHGEHDTIPLASSQEWADLILGSRLVVVPHAGHMPQLDLPDTVFFEIERFLQQLPRR